MKEQIKAPEKQLSDKELANLSDVEFKTLLIRMLTEMIQCGCKIQEEMKAIQSEIKESIQRTNSGGNEAKIQINNLKHKKQKNIQSEHQEEKRFKKKKTRKE